MAERATAKARLVVLSGPSGSGKSTVAAQALAAGDLPVRGAVSATTRARRPGEIDGVHYHFLSRPVFDDALRRGEFLEWAEVHGNRYGTLKKEVEPLLERGLSVLLEIDVQGARQICRLYPDSLRIFLRAASLAEYEKRLRARGSENEADLQGRLAAIERELESVGEYDVVIVNDQLNAAVQAVRDVLTRCTGGSHVG